MKQLFFHIALLISLILPPFVSVSGAQWIRVNGPYVQGGYGGYPQQLTISGDVAFISTDDGIFVSKDSGRTWLPINNGLPITFTGGIAGIGSIFFTSAGSSLYSSSDQGERWNYVSGFPTTFTISWVQSVGSNLYAVVDTGSYSFTTFFFLSTDSGRTWKTLDPDLPGIYHLFSYGAYLLAGTDSGVFRSSDRGFTWARSSTGINSDAEVLCFGSMDTTRFPGANDSSIYQSTDSGKTWSNKGTSIPWYLDIYNIVVVGNDLIASGNFPGLFRSSDTGRTWLNDTTIYPNTIQVPCLGLVGNTLVAGCESFELYSEDSGVTWNLSSSGLGYVGPQNIIIFGGELFCTNDLSIYYSTDSGLDWDALSNSPAGYDLENDGNDLILASHSGIYISRDSGVSWTLEDTSFKDVGNLTSIGPSLFGISNSKGIIFSSDTGYSWSSISGSLNGISQIAACGSALIAYQEIDYYTNESHLYASIGPSSGWSQIDTGLRTENLAWATDGETIYVLGNALYRTSDLGRTWDSIAVLPIFNPLYDKCQMSASGSDLVITDSRSIYISSDGGHTWDSSSIYIAEPGEISPSYLIFASGYLFGVTTESGLFREKVTNNNSIVENPMVNNDLFSIYPNPVESHATISFSLSEGSLVSLKLVDVTGKEQSILANQWLNAGTYSEIWNPELESNGTYICNLSANGLTSSQKVVLLK